MTEARVSLPAAAVALAAEHNITFDRPYLLLVSAKSTGEPLFLAKVANPAGGLARVSATGDHFGSSRDTAASGEQCGADAGARLMSA